MDEWSWLPRRDKGAPAPKSGETRRAKSYGVKRVGRRLNVRKRLELGPTSGLHPPRPLPETPGTSLPTPGMDGWVGHGRDQTSNRVLSVSLTTAPHAPRSQWVQSQWG
ncbi:hypothetical protein Y032_0001g350 [Ancylostoma ceylanicum]|uniref:Uncharacterized protein n=1 Tax=Ancylostoma ceylanicum TaxID=53326 RepID=A0A016W5K3_9BILA|nr:hypothetical protein Y032_0001g350 [Ancylostoma ceylanicum]